MQQLDEVEILWPTNWDDGPTRGVAQLGDRHFFFSAVFDQVKDEYTNNPRVLTLYAMTEQEFQQEAAAHRRFEDLVGNTRHCYHLPKDQRHGRVGSPEQVAGFYEVEQARMKLDYENRPQAGWFEWIRNDD
jgi:hypothetical protein